MPPKCQHLRQEAVDDSGDVVEGHEKEQADDHDDAESVQLYHCDEFTSLLADGGLQLDRLFGNYDGTPYTPDQPRMIAVGGRA